MTAGASLSWTIAGLLALPASANPQGAPTHRRGANRLACLDELDPFWPDVRAPKLTTPMWIGPEDADAGVEAAVVLSIDDMRDAVAYEAFLRPILARLKQVEVEQGRAARSPMSIFTCSVKLDDAPQREQLRRFVADGISLECHTVDHPCPLFRGGDLELAKASLLPCIDQLAGVEGNEAVAFRMPCCDSLNTDSPRFYAQLLPLHANEYRILSFDSSVQNVFTSDDPELPRELVQDPDGSERFLKLLPRDNRFTGFITNHPYPYVIGNRCWELPFATPSDWQAQHLRGPNQEATLADLEAALDLTVLKQGLFTLVFHPHGWIRNDQIVALIDHAVAKWGRKVRFLSVRDVKERIEKNVHDTSKDFLSFDPLAHLLDLDEDGLVDWVADRATGRWNTGARRWEVAEFPASLGAESGRHGTADYHARFGVIHGDGRVSVLIRAESSQFNARELVPPYEWAGSFDGSRWIAEPELLEQVDPERGRRPLAADGSLVFTARVATPHSDAAEMLDGGVRLRDLDGDGACELIVSNRRQNALFRYDAPSKGWRQLPFRLPTPCSIDGGIRFVDLDEDGDLDLLVSGTYLESKSGPSRRFRESAAWLFESLDEGWTRPLLNLAERIDAPPAAFATALPLFARADSTDNGMFVHERALWWVNEETDRLPGHCDRRSFNELLAPAFPIGSEPPPRSAEASLRSLHPRPGFVAQLVASEPLVTDPISIEWGADGRLWVVEMGDYPLGADGNGAKGGRVKFLEDPDGDGVFDRATTFLDGLPFPTSVLPWRDGVLVTAAPDLLFAADRDGDGRAEVRETLFRGFGEGNPQHRVNGLRLGLDGWVYGANGDSDGEIVSTKTGARVDISGRDWRCDPDRGLFEAVTGCTQYGRDRDDFDDWFGGNNVVPAWHFLLQERVQVPAIPGSQPLFPASFTRARFNDLDTANHFTSACSPTIYRDELFGPAFSKSLFVCDPVHNLVHREAIERKGVTFTSRRGADEQASEFLASSDPWFRPVQTRTGPDGALWVVDMYRDVIEHPEWIEPEVQAKLDLRAGADMGRLYRVFPVDRAPRPIRRLDRASDLELAEALRSPNGWTRDTAQRLLVERRAKGVAPALERMAKEGPPRTRVQALWTLEHLGVLEGDLLVALLRDRDGDPDVLVPVLRLCEGREDPEQLLTHALNELRIAEQPSRVLLQLASTLGEWRSWIAGDLLGHVRRLGDDLGGLDARMIRAAVVSSLRPDSIGGFVKRCRADGVDRTADGAAWLAGLSVELGDFDAAQTLLGDFTPHQRGWNDAARVALAIAGAAEEGELPPGLRAALHARSDEARSALRGAGEFDGRDAALALLGRDRAGLAADLDLLASFLSPQSDPPVALAAARRLGEIDDASVPPRLLAAWRSASPPLRAEILDALLHRQAWLPALLDAVEARTIAPHELDLAVRQRLLQDEDEALRSRAAALLETKIDPDRQRVVEAFRPALALAGDLARGQPLFERKCATCHELRGVGHVVGPDLAAVSDQPPETLLVAILDPNRAVETRYVNYVAVTKDGEIWSGIVVDESTTAVTLRDSGGKEQKVARADLKSLRSSAKSLMTEGLEADLSPQELADLLAFVRGANRARPGKRIAGNEPAVVRPLGECGALHCAAAAAEIYGPRLTFEPRYQNLGWWQSADDLAAWTFEPGAAAICDVVVEFACDASAAGGTLLLEAGGQKIAFEVPSTGTWDDYREQTIGALTLSPGPQRLVARAAAPPRSALIDLREIRLVPRK